MSSTILQLLGAAQAAVIEAQGLDLMAAGKNEKQTLFRDLIDDIDRLMAFYEPSAKDLSDGLGAVIASANPKVITAALPGSEYEPYEPSPYHGDYSEE